ncbi:EAL domain-containing protein [Gammaproteobacteria bacterium AB-CW1]|uniref:cyclic-guanylate-specific phosphodiesterase n=1 Tax=Natronospira elongata TaxID=3110268 RepID=A0AAP6JG55_9GAMM|nr:EAL domain-containing protein [Gammaproteobacteria bacterium AB-CW1]
MLTDTEGRSRAELIRSLYHSHRGSYPLALLAALLVALLFRDPFNGLAYLFLAWMVVAEGARAVAHLAFWRFGDAKLSLQLRLWENAFLATAYLSALGWGLAGLLFFPAEMPALTIALALILLTINALVAAAGSTHFPYVAGFLILSCSPLLIRLMLAAEPLHFILAALMFTVAVLLLASSWHGSRHLRELLELRFSYANMAQDLADEIFAKQETESRLDELAHYDPLTGLPNRSMFRQQLTRRIREHDRRGSRFTVLFLDVDRFKSINDSLGHDIGDKILREIGRRLASMMDESEMVARQSSDEFLLSLQSQRSKTVTRRLEEIIRVVNQPIQLEDTELRVNCSVGVAFFPDDGHSAEALIQHADIAMARAKQSGNNSYQFFQADMHREAMQRLALETALRRAINGGQLHLHYQPQVDAISGRILGVEALARWQDPEHGNVSPGDFIPLAEETGLIVPLGKWVLEEACRHAHLWQARTDEDFYISVNLSVGQFDTGQLVEDVRTTLEEHQVAPERLVLEITESLVMNDPEHHIALLRELKALGLRLALDDFGTGYSSLSYLRQLPIDILKLDRQFVRNVASSKEEAAIARATITMAAEIGLTVVAEGVETQEQLRWLLQQDCHLVQGFFFSKPLSDEELEKLITLPRSELVSHWPRY